MAQPPAVVKTSPAEIMDLIIMRTDRRSYEAAVVPPYHPTPLDNVFFQSPFHAAGDGQIANEMRNHHDSQ